MTNFKPFWYWINERYQIRLRRGSARLDDAALREGLTICPPAHLALGRAAPSADIAGVLVPQRR